MTETINITISGQEISIAEKEIWVSNTGGVYVASFSFTGWSEFTTRKAVFENIYGDRETIEISGSSCTLPASALMEGDLKIGAYGTDGSGRQLPTLWAKVYVHIGAKDRILEDDYGNY